MSWIMTSVPYKMEKGSLFQLVGLMSGAAGLLNIDCIPLNSSLDHIIKYDGFSASYSKKKKKQLR